LIDTIWQKQKRDELLRLLRSGDQRAFAQFIDKYKEIVFLCCRRLGLNEDEVEDVASETFLAAYKGLKYYQGQAELSTWLWSIAYQQAISYLRKNRRKWKHFDDPDEQIIESDGHQPVSAAQNREEEEIIWQQVKKLPKLWAMAIILYYKEQKSISEIAKIMKLRQNTVKTYLFRAREKLKQILAPIFGEGTDAFR
jgi:RNA polymerase sigma-70 factor (ECF subfamily)